MKVKQLITELQKLDGELDIFVNHDYTEHTCREGEYCYCSCEAHILSLASPMIVEDMSIYDKISRWERNKKRGHKPPAIVISVSE